MNDVGGIDMGGKDLWLVPVERAETLLASLARIAASHPGVELRVERRDGERRRRAERRREPGAGEDGDERRLLRSATGRRVGERRGDQLPVPPPPGLPAALAGHVSFVRAQPLSRGRLRDMEGTRLALALQGGAPEALGALHDLYNHELRAYFRRSLRDNHEAEDLAHETLLRAHEEIARWEHRHRPFRVWLFTLGQARLGRHVRSAARVAPVAPHELVDLLDAMQRDGRGPGNGDGSTPGGLDAVQDPELARTLAELDDDHRRILTLRYEHDFPPAHAAAVLGMQVDAFYKAEQRILARLRGVLEPTRSPVRPRRRQAMWRRMRPAPVMAARRFALWKSPSPAAARHRYR